MVRRRRFSSFHVMCAMLTLVFASYQLVAQSPKTPPASSIAQQSPWVSHAEAFAISQPLKDLGGPLDRQTTEINSLVGPLASQGARNNLPPESYSLGLVFQGLGNGFAGYSVSANPPDTNMAVGSLQVVQAVDSSFVVFNKSTGNPEGSFASFASLFAPLGGRCATLNNGNPIVQFDVRANRWILVQNVLTSPYAVCIAVSQSFDATGAYFLYQFTVPGGGFPDYQKFGLWSTGWFQTMNNMGPNGQTFVGAETCGYNSTKLLVGDPTAEQICFQLTANDKSLLPADIDSPSTFPPTGQDEFLIGGVGAVDNSHLSLYSVHVDFANPNNSTITGTNNSQLLAIAAFTPACGGSYSGDCVPQPGVNSRLLSLGDRLMYRFAYYSDDGSFSAIPVTDLSVFQQGTVAPDPTYRWMGSIAGDLANDILLGYSTSSSTIFPSINLSGRAATDPPGTMEPEQSVLVGTGAQSASPWGSYSAMRLDPSDNCIFWYTTEYYLTTAAQNWSTEVSSARFNSCGPPPVAKQHWYVAFDVTASAGQNGVRWMELVPGLPTVTTVTSSPNSSSYFQPVTIQAQVLPIGSGGTPTGTVNFADTFNNVLTSLCTAVPINNQGLALCTTSVLQVGTHSQIVATYSGDSTFAGSSGTDTPPQVVNQASTQTVVTSTPNPSEYNQVVTITAAVTGAFGGTPTGTVNFLDGQTLLCGAVQLSNTGTATCQTQTLSVGTHGQITASYSGDQNYLASLGQEAQTVNQAVTAVAVTSAPNPSQYGQLVVITAVVSGQFGGTPTGTVDFRDGATLLCGGVLLGNTGTATCQTATLSVGTHSQIMASYNGDQNFLASSGQETQIVTKVASTVTVTSAPNPSQFGQSAVVTAVVSGVPGGGLPSGTVTFTDTFNGVQTTLCSGVQLNELDTARCSTATLACGTHSQLVASYSGDQNYLPGNGTDNPPQVVVGCGDFTVLPISPGAVQVTQTFTNNDDPFHPQAINVTVQPLNGYSSTVQLSCSVSPPLTGGSCTVNPPTSGSLATGNLNTTLTISVGSTTPTGNYIVTVLAQDDSGLMHTATLALTVDEKTTGLTMTTGGTGPPVPVVFGPGPGVVDNLSCTLVSGTGIAGTEDFGLIGGVCSFNPTTTNLPDPVVVTISGCTIAQLGAGTRFYASLWFGLPGIVLLGSFRKRPRAAKKLLRMITLFLAVSILLIGMGCGGVGQTTPTGSYLVLVQGTGADGTVYSAVIPVTVKPLGQ